MHYHKTKVVKFVEIQLSTLMIWEIVVFITGIVAGLLIGKYLI